ncbi:NAD(P)H nitroreductase [Saccharopolyspora halophila]|uniref:NAD(P)H nitroreductase n=1 Tax=Saccharopolyspora halophila TaxID=405551 RepID=A0ABP5SYE3_9PSEU
MAWSPDDMADLVEAVSRAPSVHNSRPWELTLHGRAAVLRENRVELLRHDPGGRDQRISCGTALTNLELAVRGLGWRAQVDLHAGSGEVSGSVTAGARAEPSSRELRWARAMPQRHSYRQRFDPTPLPERLRRVVRDATRGARTGARWIGSDAEALSTARMLGYAARVFRANADYSRELAGWRSPVGEELRRVSGGLHGLSAVGLAAADSDLPDDDAVAERIREEAVLLIGTRGDRPDDHVRAGQAVERAWLAATSAGLAASVTTQPLHLGVVRVALAKRLGTPLIPQVLMRFGYPPGSV